MHKMIELIIIKETRSSSKSDWMYIKSTIDYYYKPRSCSLKKIFAKTKTELIKQDAKISILINNTQRSSKVIICADYDRDEEINSIIKKYCTDNLFDLAWMNLDVEDVYLGRQVSKNNKTNEAISFQKMSDKLLPKLKNLNINDPLNSRHSSNILIILDKYLERK